MIDFRHWMPDACHFEAEPKNLNRVITRPDSLPERSRMGGNLNVVILNEVKNLPLNNQSPIVNSQLPPPPPKPDSTIGRNTPL